MPWQLIYTSALRTLVAGQSGYGTVARSAGLREALAQRLEQLSYYSHGAGQDAASHPVIHAYRILDFRGSRYHVLSRLQNAGLDFSKRTNHLAHHLVFEPAELAALPPPTIIFMHFDGWRSSWQQEPTLLKDENWENLQSLPRCLLFPASTWQESTGDGGNAAALLDRARSTNLTLVFENEHLPKMLNLLAESLQLADPTGRQPIRLWSYTFTTFLQAEDNPADFRWRACLEGSPGWHAAQRINDPLLLPISQARAPSNALALLARQGPPRAPSSGAAGPRPPPAGRPAQLPPAWRDPPPPATKTASTSAPTRLASTRKRAAESQGARFCLDLTTPRVWVPALALVAVLVFLLLAFGWPGWLVSRGQKEQPAAPARKSVAVQVATPEINRDALAEPAAAPSGPEPAVARAPVPPSPPTKDALAQLAPQADAVPTWVVALESKAASTLPGIPELHQLLRQLFLADRPLAFDAIDCRILPGRLDFSRPGGNAAALKEEYQPRGLSARLSQEVCFQLDCSTWLAEGGRGGTVSFIESGLRKGNLLVVTFQSRIESATFSPFRLVILGAKPFEPLLLSKSLLVAQGETFKTSLQPSLLEWIEQLHVADPHAQWQLRPSSRDSARTDLLDNLAEAFRPDTEHPFDFESIRQRIAVPRALDEAKLTNLVASTDELQAAIQTDRLAGQILGRYTNELSSLPVYAKARNRKVDRQTYLAYLKEMLGSLDRSLLPRLPSPEASEEETRLALASLPAFIAQNPELKKRAERLPPGYFEARWEDLGRMPELMHKSSELDSTRKSISRYEGYLNLVPADLAATPRVSLVLVTNGRRYEMVRFEDSLPTSARTSP